MGCSAGLLLPISLRRLRANCEQKHLCHFSLPFEIRKITASNEILAIWSMRVLYCLSVRVRVHAFAQTCNYTYIVVRTPLTFHTISENVNLMIHTHSQR